MYKESTISLVEKTYSRLSRAEISIYRISQIIGEPESVVHRIMKLSSYSYSEKRAVSILEKINTYLDELEGKKLARGISDNPHDSELFIKLYKLGLDSKSFTPEEKLKLAIAHKELKEKQQ